MWILIPVILGVFVIASAGSRREESYAPAIAAGGPPGPIAVLGAFLQRGEQPPPPVILCAIAEAQSIGRDDLANQIVQTFVAPVVYADQAAKVARAKPGGQRGGPPRAAAAKAVQSTQATDEQIRAALDADPQAFVDRAARGTPPVIDAQAVEKPVEKELVPVPVAVAAATQPLQSIVVGRIPVPDVDVKDWSKFCGKLAREAPTYSSNRHVGQFRQRRERLIELGLDPDAVVGSPEAQAQALVLDVENALTHVRGNDELARHIGRLIRVPGHEDACQVSLSGVLGIAQAAGLEKAVSWLENPEDRKQFWHTTKVFVDTNGVF